MPAAADARTAFRRLHEAGCFVLPNPWDVGSARYLQHLGFAALATTSSGAAFSMGLPDTDAHEPAQVAANVRPCVDTGVAGLSIEDTTGDPHAPLHPLDRAADRIRAARAALDAAGADAARTSRAVRAPAPRAQADVVTPIRGHQRATGQTLQRGLRALQTRRP